MFFYLGQLTSNAEPCIQDPVDLIEQKPDCFLQFTLVIATDLADEPLLKLSELLWQANIPLIVARSYGFTGYIRIAVPEHTGGELVASFLFSPIAHVEYVRLPAREVVAEPHPDAIIDLRLDCPFPALSAFVSQFDFKAMDSKDHSHTPFPVILIKCLEEWKAKVRSLI